MGVGPPLPLPSRSFAPPSTVCRIRVKPDKTGVDLTAVKMSMNPFDEVRAPPLDGVAARPLFA